MTGGDPSTPVGPGQEQVLRSKDPKIQRSKKGHFSSDEVMSPGGGLGTRPRANSQGFALRKQFPTTWTLQVAETEETGECAQGELPGERGRGGKGTPWEAPKGLTARVCSATRLGSRAQVMNRPDAR